MAFKVIFDWLCDLKMYVFFIIIRQNKNKSDFIRLHDWILPHDFKLFYKSAIHLFMSITEQKLTLTHSYVIRQLALPLK